MSKEHVWPKWASRALNLPPAPNRIEATWTMSPDSPDPRKTSHKERPGPTYTKQLRVVCESCNNGWMGDIEQSAKPVMSPLILGQSTSIDVISQLTIATWAMLKIFVVEQANPDEAIASQEVRWEFMTSRALPQGLRLWIARCGFGGWESTFYRHSLCLSKAPVKMVPPYRHNTQSVTFGIGALVIHAHHTSVPEVDLNIAFAPKDIVPQIHPISASSINWPPRRTLLPMEVNNLSLTLMRVGHQPGVTWFR
jgi:hypothetical protein